VAVASDRPAAHGVSPKTLLIAGASSAAAAFLVPLIWKSGTVVAAAVTPVVVAVVSALLERPVEAVSAVTPRLSPTAKKAQAPDDDEFDPLAPPPLEDLEALNREVPQRTRHAEPRRRRLTGKQWRLAIVTGLLAFVAAAAVITFIELAAGDAVTAPGARTTIFGGSRSSGTDTDTDTDKDKDKEKATPTPERSATPTPSGTPTPSATRAPSATPTPTPSVAGAEPSPAAAPPAETATPAP
jgi:hypothetical protein